jgi:hypothetical protein
MHPFGAARKRWQRYPPGLSSAEQAGRPRRRRTGRRCGVRWHGFGDECRGLGRIPADRLSSYPSSRHADVNKTAILIPDSVDPGTESGD